MLFHTMQTNHFLKPRKILEVLILLKEIRIAEILPKSKNILHPFQMLISKLSTTNFFTCLNSEHKKRKFFTNSFEIISQHS